MAGSKRIAAPVEGARWANHQALRKHLARRLQALRARHGFTQAELAEHARVGERQLGKLERAEGGGSLETWHKLANALEVPLEELFRSAPPDTVGSGAREPAHPYGRLPTHRRPASPRQLETLQLAAQQLDAKSMRALVILARRLARAPRS